MLKKLFVLLSLVIEDFFILLGLSLIIYSTYTINILAGNYLLGFILVVIGFLLAKRHRKEVKR